MLSYSREGRDIGPKLFRLLKVKTMCMKAASQGTCGHHTWYPIYREIPLSCERDKMLFIMTQEIIYYINCNYLRLGDLYGF